MRYLKNVSSLELNTGLCTGCGRCVEVCPHGVFEIESKKARITDKDLCMECGACQKNCAFKAIKVNAGVGCAAALINGMLTGGEPSCDCSGGEKESCC